ncbi:hypothetical protein [uncultured Cloacibacillus sp.]|uniref:hypothetical protein n=1 Tax=uncultured Cloacibacillus sp. TaxID=889794 RepID=UPI002623DDB3|nr:hypothetical protein [uncultured Cloacibacillus sp.]
MLKRKLYKKWALCFLSIFAGVTASVMAINYAVDPMWCFNHDTPFAEWREFIDDRPQKTNLLRFRDFRVDTLIIGSSRTMSLDPFKADKHAFNYGLGGCMAVEYPTIIEMFHKAKGYYPSKIIVGLDFFGASSIYGDRVNANRSLSAMQIFNKNSLIYKLEMLASIELSRKSINLIRKNINFDEIGIGHGDVKYRKDHMGANLHYPPVNDMVFKKHLCRGTYLDYKKSYEFFEYNEQYKENLSCLVKPPVIAEVKAFVTPEGTMTMRLIAETPGRLNDYERMLRESVEVFGGIWNFMYVNSVTSNHEYWREPSHCVDSVNEWVLERMLGTGNPPADFGVYVTSENIDHHIEEVRAQFLALLNQKDSWSIFIEE